MQMMMTTTTKTTTTTATKTTTTKGWKTGPDDRTGGPRNEPFVPKHKNK